MSERQILLDNPALFLLHYFPDWLEGFEPFHLRLIETATTQNRGLTLYPAGHGKTTIVSTLLPIWAICKNPNIRIGLVTKNQDDAEQIMQAIEGELVMNQPLIRDFGPFWDKNATTKSWSLHRFDVAKKTRGGKSATMAAFGVSSRGVLGYRTDWTVLDDCVTDKNSATPTERAKLRNWFDLAAETGPEGPAGRMTVVGTLFDPEDLYHDLIELLDPETGEPIWYVQREDAIVPVCVCGHERSEHRSRQWECSCDCEEFIFDPDAKETLWPAIWPWGSLMRQKAKLGTLSFNKRYRNIAVDASRMVFREEYVRGGYVGGVKYPGCLDRNYKVGVIPDGATLYAGFDPAIGSYRDAKFCAHLTLAVGSCPEHERCFWIVDLLRDQYTLPQQVERILGQHEAYDVFTTKVEANSYQKGLLDALQAVMSERGLAYRIEPHYTTRTNKPDPELGVQSMGPAFENGQVHIPWGNQESQRKMQVLVDELVMYPGRTTDTVLAMWFAWRAAELAAPKFKGMNRLTNPRMTHWGKRVRGNVIRNPAYAKE